LTTSYLLIALVATVILLIVIAFFLVRLYGAYKRMDESFAKIGYLAREDTKKYFDQASSDATGIYNEALQKSKTVIEESLNDIISRSQAITEKTIADAQKQASGIILQANEEAEKIKSSAKEGSSKYFDQAVGSAVEAIEWSMTQYIKEKFTLSEHEEIIKKLVDVYVDERK